MFCICYGKSWFGGSYASAAALAIWDDSIDITCLGRDNWTVDWEQKEREREREREREKRDLIEQAIQRET